MYALIKNNSVVKYPYWIVDLKRDNPNISFPRNPSDAALAAFGMLVVFNNPEPTVTATQVAEQGTPTFNTQNQRWEQTWSVRNLSADEIQSKSDSMAVAIRAERDALIATTDWRFCSDLTPSQDWKDYRQALRDVPAQAGFPWSVEWPTQPE